MRTGGVCVGERRAIPVRDGNVGDKKKSTEVMKKINNFHTKRTVLLWKIKKKIVRLYLCVTINYYGFYRIKNVQTGVFFFRGPKKTSYGFQLSKLIRFFFFSPVHLNILQKKKIHFHLPVIIVQ